MIVVLAGLGFFMAYSLPFHEKNSVLSSSAPLFRGAVSISKNEQTAPGLPVRLQIPRISVDAAIESVGITPKKEMDVPKIPANAAWYNLGPRPGEVGSSVIDGHFGYKDNIPAVFDNLSKLRKGDKLYVKADNGTTFTFVVRETRKYGPGEIVPEVFHSSDGKSHLNLVTCEGAWNVTLKGYTSRLVVFTDKE